jgi:hypothetical protein
VQSPEFKPQYCQKKKKICQRRKEGKKKMKEEWRLFKKETLENDFIHSFMYSVSRKI